MNDKPEALRLAEHLEKYRSFSDDQAAATLSFGGITEVSYECFVIV